MSSSPLSPLAVSAAKVVSSLPKSDSTSIYKRWAFFIVILLATLSYYGYQWYLAQRTQPKQEEPEEKEAVLVPPPQLQEQPQQQIQVRNGQRQQPSGRQIIAQEQEFEQNRISALDKALDNAADQHSFEPQPIASGGKSGWCLTGQDLGIDICAEVGANDVCMSGDVYPSQAICMNPSLRP